MCEMVEFGGDVDVYVIDIGEYCYGFCEFCDDFEDCFVFFDVEVDEVVCVV